MKCIRLVTRTSELALWQARFIEQAIYHAHPHFSDLNIELIGVKTQGDKILETSLSKVGGKGLFVKELEDKLLSQSADLAVHSLKDVPYQLPVGLVLAAFGEREDPRDVLISPKYGHLALLPKGATVGTSSLRRQAQLLKIRPDLHCHDLRGNVPTRIQKCMAGQYDAIILAAAGVKRLGLEKHISQYLDTEAFLPAVGQGVLALECHEENQALMQILSPLNHQQTYLSTLAERSLNQALKGGCQVPIAAYAHFYSENNNNKQTLGLKLTARVLTPDGKLCLEAFGQLVGIEAFEPEAIRQLGQTVAKCLIQQGADKIIAACYTNEGS